MPVYTREGEMGSTVWIDALTPKQARLAAFLAARFTSKGYNVVITVREYEYTVSVARRFAPPSARIHVVGRHGGGELESKLVADLERAQGLARLVARLSPCMLVSYPSPSALRVSFGLAIPSAVLVDTPHAYHANRLAVPLATYVVYSSFIPRERVERYVLREFTKLVDYRGFDELEYVLPFIERGVSASELERLGLEPYSYVVVRPAEYKAAYYQGKRTVPLEELAVRLASRGVRVVFFPRYPEQARKVEGVENIVVPEEAVDTLQLLYYAAVVVTGGSTLAREAALLGTPGVTVYPDPVEVNEAVASLGFPLYQPGAISVSELENLVMRLARLRPDRKRVENLVRSLEPPGEVLERLLDHHCR